MHEPCNTNHERHGLHGAVGLGRGADGTACLEDVLVAAALPHGGAYTSAGSYDWREMQTLVQLLAAHTGISGPELLTAYDRHLFTVFVQRFPRFFGPGQMACQFLSHVEDYIHPEVEKLYHAAELPRFEMTERPGQAVLDYRSPRPFAALAQGLIEGCLRHFGELADVVFATGPLPHAAVVRCDHRGPDPTAPSWVW